MEVQPDFRELLALFNDHSVEYLIVGGYALAFHGAPRFTGDLDLFIRPDGPNADRILAALAEFGFASLGLRREDFVATENVIQLGLPPVRIDLLTFLSGVSWAEALSGRVPGSYGDIPVHYLGRKELITNKRATDRSQDRADLEALGEL